MDQLSRISYEFRKSKAATVLATLYVLVSAVEITAEYFEDSTLIYATKPLIILLLIALYWKTSRHVNFLYIVALLFSWGANIFFVSKTFDDIFAGAMLFFVYRTLVIYIAIRHTKLPSIFPMIVGCVPFLFIYAYLVYLTYDAIGRGLPIFIVQCVLISFLGGLSVGNYILRSNRANTLLLISTLFFAMNQFLFVIRLYYVDLNIFQPLAMALFAAAQYLFYKFMLAAEKRRAGYKLAEDHHD
jgi:hypothetical protein